MKREIIAAGTILALALLLSACYHTPKTTSQASTVSSPSPDLASITTGATVTWSDEAGFAAAEVTVKAGEKVEFKNQGSAVVQINSDPHPTHTSFPVLNIGQIASGSLKSAVFDKAGTYKYHNHLNASQRGVIIVQ